MFAKKNAADVFEEHVSKFDYSAALRQFVSDNVTFCFFLLTVCGVALVANGTRSVLSHRKVGTILMVIFVLRAYHAGTKHQRTIVIADEDTTHDTEATQD